MNATNRCKQRNHVALATALVLFMLFPYYYMIIQSLAPAVRVDRSLLPGIPTLENFRYLLNNGGSQNRMMWMRALLNSAVVTVVSTSVAVFFGLVVAYSIVKLRYLGHRLVMNFLLFQMFFPSIIMLVPTYILMKPFANTYFGMIAPSCMSLWAVFMFINYFKTLPDDVFEAARIDGSSELRMLFVLGFPAARTVATIVFLSLFMGRWSELMWDMLIAPDIKMQTLNVLITTQFKPMGNLPGPLYAASVILTAPVIVMCFAFSRYFREGLTFQFK